MKSEVVAIFVAVIFTASVSILRAQETKEESSTEEIARKLANPLAPVTTILGQFRVEGDNGPDDETNYQLRLQPSFFKPFSDQSAVLLRTIIPSFAKEWPTDDTGLGDITLAPYYVPDITKPTFVGYGGAIGLPTATEDALGSKKWTAGPAMIIAKTGQPITYGGLLQHLWSYAGDEDRGDINITTIQPFFTYLLGAGWSTTVTMEALYNWEAEEDEWTLPLAAGVSRVVQFGEKYVNFGLAGVSYVEGPETTPDWEIRFNATYVFR